MTQTPNDTRKYKPGTFSQYPHILSTGFDKKLNPTERFLAITLHRMFRLPGLHPASLREIAHASGISVGSLCTTDSDKRKREGMLHKLHRLGIIRLVLGKRVNKYGKETDLDQYYIEVVDLRAMNAASTVGESVYSVNTLEKDEEAQTVYSVNASDYSVNAGVYLVNGSDYSVNESVYSSRSNDPPILLDKIDVIEDIDYVSEVASATFASQQQAMQVEITQLRAALQQATNNTPPSKNDNHTTNVEQPQERGSAASSTRNEASDDRRDTRHSPSSSDSDSNLVGTVPATGLEMGDRGPQKSIEVGASDDRFDGRDLGASDGIRASNPAKPTRARQPKKVAPPKITFSEQEQQFWQWWCGQWFNVDIPPTLNDTAYAHVQKLAPHIKTSERLDSLIAHTRKELQERGIKRKTVYLGNCVASYSGWKQAAPPPPSPSGYVPQDGVQLVGGKPAADFTEEEIEAIPDAFKRKAIRSIRRSNALTEEEIEAFLQHPPPSSAITKHFAVAR